MNYDPGFQDPGAAGQQVAAYYYWRPDVHNACGTTTNEAYVRDDMLHTRQNDVASTGWNCYDNAVAHDGNFPWQTDCGHVSGTPPDWR